MKQYLLLCDEAGIDALKAVFRPESVQFLEVQGMGVAAGNQFNILVTPVLPPVNPMPAMQPPVQPVEQPQSVVEEPAPVVE